MYVCMRGMCVMCGVYKLCFTPLHMGIVFSCLSAHVCILVCQCVGYVNYM